MYTREGCGGSVGRVDAREGCGGSVGRVYTREGRSARTVAQGQRM